MKRRPGAVLCPTCGLGRMSRVRRDVRSRAARRTLTVRSVELDECPKCGERLYDLAALRRIRESRAKSAA